ncbi:ABC transporter ATP-binding protein [Kribbella sp. CA-293567]|uniref:ABC transporter ATP-binding protein n=1 Tax=Kribbella sp. CA-293567 TaxID=3002436 RepID=UPI0022DE6B5F|nr:ATP-binding cassette domain-containing protein [Kribbella sp. CA-293567]WBQ03413.1 ATP-binding cassette domain-containing protein [Kribbella sp. CA-293567]
MVVKGTPLVSAQGLTVRYGAQSALEDVNLTLQAGVTVLLGPNGAGKTTLVKCIAGEKRPATGELAVCGLDPFRQRREMMRLLGVLPQEPRLPRRASILEFVTYAAWLKQCPPKRADALASKALAAVGLTEQANKPAKKLSGGMQRRASIATAIVHRPPVVLLDEPMSGLDPAQRANLRATIRDIAGDDACVLVTTHILQDVPELADRVIVLTDGMVRFDGSVEEFARRADSAASATQLLESAYQAIVNAPGEPR